MTRAEFTAKYPRASEAVIRLNCSDSGPAPVAKIVAPSNPKKPRRQMVPRTRNAGTWTEAQYFQSLRSCLRRVSMFWKPAQAALKASRVPFNGPNNQKWAFLCADCRKLFKRSRVNIDHVTPTGALTSHEHLGGFVERLLVEDPAGFRVRCKSCHQEKTNAERSAKTFGPMSRADQFYL